MSQERKLITVIGATGLQGTSVVEHLLKHGWRVRGVARKTDGDCAKELSRKGVEMIEADVNRPSEELRKLFKGAYGAYILTTFPNTDNEKEQGINLVEAAKHENVHHLVFSWLPNVEKISKGKYKLGHFTNKGLVGEHVSKLGFPVVTFLGPGFYYQNFENFFPPKKVDNEWVIEVPETRRLQMFDVQDTGKIVSAIFKDPKGLNGKHIPVVAFDGSLDKIESILHKSSGEKIRIKAIPRDKFAQKDISGAKELAEMFGWIDEFGVFGPDADLGLVKKLCPDLTSLETWAKHFKPSELQHTTPGLTE